MANFSIQFGMNGRFFPGNWRPARDEIVFASLAGFRCIQFPGPPGGLGTERLGDSLETVSHALSRAGITAVMEMVVPLFANGRTEAGQTPLEVLQANLQALTVLPCVHAHWHITLKAAMSAAQVTALENDLIPQFSQAVALAKAHGFRFGFEHNSADVPIFHRPERCAAVLTAVPDLGFVWDFNHTAPDAFTDFAALASRASLLHISDSPWPEVNHHLPLGQGSLDIAAFVRPLVACGYDGPAILEIGGLPKSGGYGRDTDAALHQSRRRLSTAIQSVRSIA